MVDPQQYFEKQHDRDCTVQSLNNALGGRALDRSEVLKYIDRKVKEETKYVRENGGLRTAALGNKEIARRLREKYASGNSYFAADVVWDCARDKGVISAYAELPGFRTPFVYQSTVDMARRIMHGRAGVILGKTPGGANHAVAVRGGETLLDTMLHGLGPRPFTIENLRKSLSEIYGAYVLLTGPAATPSAIRRAVPLFSF